MVRLNAVLVGMMVGFAISFFVILVIQTGEHISRSHDAPRKDRSSTPPPAPMKPETGAAYHRYLDRYAEAWREQKLREAGLGAGGCPP